MPTQKLKNKNVRKLLKLAGRSLAVTIPIELAERLKLREGQKVKFSLKGQSLILRDWKGK